jgi:tryptophanyl-tRNA synthetase
MDIKEKRKLTLAVKAYVDYLAYYLGQHANAFDETCSRDEWLDSKELALVIIQEINEGIQQEREELRERLKEFE